MVNLDLALNPVPPHPPVPSVLSVWWSLVDRKVPYRGFDVHNTFLNHMDNFFGLILLLRQQTSKIVYSLKHLCSKQYEAVGSRLSEWCSAQHCNDFCGST